MAVFVNHINNTNIGRFRYQSVVENRKYISTKYHYASLFACISVIGANTRSV